MCMIQTYDVINPDGTRRTSERLLNCERGTRSQPCNNTSRDPFLDERDATSAEIRAAHQGRHPIIITPSSMERPRPHRQRADKPKGVLGCMNRLFGVSVRTSPKNNHEKEPQRFFVRTKRRRPWPAGGRIEDRQPVPVRPPPRAPTPPAYHHPPPSPGPSILPTSPIIVPIEPPREHRSRRQEPRPSGQAPRTRQRPPPQEREMEREPRRRTRQPPVVHQSSSEEDSHSPPTASRRHQRRTRSLSPRSRYEEEKRATKEMERQQHADRRARAARLEQEAHDRAVRLAEDERRNRSRNRQREERQRRLEESEEIEERRRIESGERARRRQRREEEERNQRRRDEARERQVEADRERLRRQQDQMAERERLERLDRANIPRRPRHHSTVHGESLAERGERFVHDAVRGENARQSVRERQMPPAAYGRYNGGFLGRRNTIDGGQWRRRGWEGR